MPSARSLLRPLLVAISIALAAARPAVADDVDARAAAEADELFHKGGQAYDAGDFALARSLYEKAFAKKKTHDIAAMLAQTEMKLGRPCEADVHLAWAVANFPPSLTDERRARILRARAEVKKQIGALRIETVPVDAAVQVDFQPLPASALPGPVCVAAGERLVYLSRDGFAVERRVVIVEPGASATLTVELRRVPPSAASGAPTSSATAAGRSSPIAPLRLDAPPPEIHPPSAVAYSGLFAGIGAVLTGAILLPIAVDRGSKAEALAGEVQRFGSGCPVGDGVRTDHPNECARLRSLREDQALFLNVGLTSILAGAAFGAAAGGFLFLRSPSGGSRPGGPRVTVGAAPDGAFIALKGAF